MKNKIKIGYHYTSLSCWKKIKEKGYMVPYAIDHPSVLDFYPNGLQGIWLWENNPKGLSHAGNIVLQISRKAETKIVKLRVYYRDENRLTYGETNWFKRMMKVACGKRIELTHTGMIGDLTYHLEKALIHDGPIPVGDIELMGTYDFVECMKKKSKPLDK